MENKIPKSREIIHQYRSLESGHQARAARGRKLNVQFRHYRGSRGSRTTLAYYVDEEENLIYFNASVYRPYVFDVNDVYKRAQQKDYALLNLFSEPKVMVNCKTWDPRTRESKIHHRLLNPREIDKTSIYVEPPKVQRTDQDPSYVPLRRSLIRRFFDVVFNR